MTTKVLEGPKEQIANRSVLITSWFDESEKSWRASAPSYSHLCTTSGISAAYTSRKAAIARIVSLLTASFAGGRH